MKKHEARRLGSRGRAPCVHLHRVQDNRRLYFEPRPAEKTHAGVEAELVSGAVCCCQVGRQTGSGSDLSTSNSLMEWRGEYGGSDIFQVEFVDGKYQSWSAKWLGGLRTIEVRSIKVKFRFCLAASKQAIHSLIKSCDIIDPSSKPWH